MDPRQDLEPHGAEAQPISTGRLEAFSDGIIAIAATLLILDVHKPNPRNSLMHWFSDSWIEIDAYLIAFITIGIMWVNHHTLFHAVRRVNRPLLFLNIALLATIAFLPLPTATAGQNPGDPASVAFFSGAFGCAGVCFALIWFYLHHHPELLEPSMRPTTGLALRRTAIGPVCYAIAALTALIAPGVSLGLNALIALYFVLPPRPLRRKKSTPTKPTSLEPW